jgi:predicted RNA-binding Zn-ribbon protein involved in translation (DUF1610 family)
MKETLPMKCPKEKVEYASFEEAAKACGGLAKMLKASGHKRPKVRAYICPECGWWHVGRGAKGRDADWNRRKLFRIGPE